MSEIKGVSIGSGIGSIESVIDQQIQVCQRESYKHLSPRTVPNILINMAAGRVAIKFGLKGPLHAPATACAAGASAIGDAYRTITYGDADLMLAGASESSINAFSLSAFAKYLSHISYSLI